MFSSWIMSNNGAGGRKRANAATSGRATKIRKPRKPSPDDEDSNDSNISDQMPQEQRSPSPMPDEPMVKLPEVIFQFYVTQMFVVIFLCSINVIIYNTIIIVINIAQISCKWFYSTLLWVLSPIGYFDLP